MELFCRLVNCTQYSLKTDRIKRPFKLNSKTSSESEKVVFVAFKAGFFTKLKYKSKLCSELRKDIGMMLDVGLLQKNYADSITRLLKQSIIFFLLKTIVLSTSFS
jgi:hypothetical protein